MSIRHFVRLEAADDKGLNITRATCTCGWVFSAPVGSLNPNVYREALKHEAKYNV